MALKVIPHVWTDKNGKVHKNTRTVNERNKPVPGTKFYHGGGKKFNFINLGEEQ